MTTADSPYPLGSDPADLERLDHQGRMLGPVTRILLEAAGIGRGMRVLDLGCGAGDVAFVLADLVGDGDQVQGIDRSADAVGKATVRARQRQLEQVRFTVGYITETAPGGPYDAIVHSALGPRLWAVARDAGWQPRGMLGVQPYFGPEDANGTALLAGIVRTLLPLLERTGVATAAEVALETLHQRMSEEPPMPEPSLRSRNS